MMVWSIGASIGDPCVCPSVTFELLGGGARTRSVICERGEDWNENGKSTLANCHSTDEVIRDRERDVHGLHPRGPIV
jgi:hypothetical protein